MIEVTLTNCVCVIVNVISMYLIGANPRSCRHEDALPIGGRQRVELFAALTRAASALRMELARDADALCFFLPRVKFAALFEKLL